MTRCLIGLLVILALGLLVAPLASAAPPLGKVFRIGWLNGLPRGAVDPHGHLWAAFRQGLREHGWIEGQNLVIEWRYGEGTLERLPALAAELVRLGVDVLVTGGGEPTIQALKQATSTIPIVMAVSADPVATGLVASLPRPGGNITGLSIQAAEVGGKRLALLKEAMPQASRVAVLWNAASPGKALEWQDTQIAARALGVTLQSMEVRGPDEFDGALAAIARARPDALLTFSDPLTLVHRTQIVEFAAQNRLPLMSEIKAFAEAGGLMTYGASLPDLFHRAADYVDRILKGAKPGDLPVEQPTKFELVINLKTAQALGLTIPPTLLFQADEIIR
jgi:putative tryptophan/tyrosine transport system substrate-binding protein